MKKSDLKSGMVVEYNTGELRIVIHDKLYVICNNQLKRVAHLSSFTDDLVFRGCDDSIQKVYKSIKAYNNPKLKDVYLLWERSKWDSVKKDTLIQVNYGDETYYRYFYKYKNGEVYLFAGGATSFTAENYVVYNPNLLEIVEQC